MRGNGFLPRSATRAVLAGALLTAGAWSSVIAREMGRGQSPDDKAIRETAMLMPRLHAPTSAGPLGLPMPLAPSEAARVRDIFLRQRRGDLRGAEAESTQLVDQTLLGHILADRMLARARRTPLSALLDWLQRYPDLSDGNVIRALAVGRAPAGTVVPALLPSASLPGNTMRQANSGEVDAAPARRALQDGRDAVAERLGRVAWLRTARQEGEPAYVAGLAAWRRGETAEAADLFEAASTAPQAGSSLRAAAAFWAARAHQRAGDPPLWLPWMRRAAAEPHVLHGMLARRVLGMAEPASQIHGLLSQADLDALTGLPAGRRAFALLQVGERARAEAELRCLWPQAQAEAAIARALLLVAQAARLDQLKADLASALHLVGAEASPPRLRPRGGYTLSPSLVYAVARVESAFTPGAVSPAGAEGLMQLRPESAALVAERGSAALLDPGTNLRLGQRFLTYLSRESLAGDNLLRVLVAYNAGPSSAQKWGDGGGDPLLFIETLPIDETRHYVQSALTYMGAYAARFGAPSPTLDALAAGAWPAFSSEMRH